jgi:tetratricopeptide (TPR) repeat protein
MRASRHWTEIATPGAIGGRLRPAALALALLMAAPATCRADKIVFKHSGETITGIVKAIYPTTVEFDWDGRTIIIPRSRIAQIIREDDTENIELLIEKARAALTAGNLDACQDLLDQASRLDEEDRGAYSAELTTLRSHLAEVRAAGDAAHLRIRAQELLEEAKIHLDRIELQQGIARLEEALELDSTYEPLHDQMADYMTKNRPADISLVIRYFSEYVDPNKIKADHPVLSVLPQAYAELVTRLGQARYPVDIDVRTRRLKKLSAAFTAHPEWKRTADANQLNVINKGADGVIADQIVNALETRRYDLARDRLMAWDPDEGSPKAAHLHFRHWIGRPDFERARGVLEQAARQAPNAQWIGYSSRALALYLTAQDEKARGNRAQAEELLRTLFDLRQGLAPELWKLVASAKVDYDSEEIDARIGAGDYTAAADRTIRLFEYAEEDVTVQEAAATFRRIAQEIAYKLNLGWEVGGLRIPLQNESSEILREGLGRVFNLKFDEASPFSLNILIAHRSGNNKQEAIRNSVVDHPVDAFERDYLDVADHDYFPGMIVDISVSHELDPQLFVQQLRDPAIPGGVALGRVDAGTNVYLDFGQPADLNRFLKSDLPLYLPNELRGLGPLLVLKRR